MPAVHRISSPRFSVRRVTGHEMPGSTALLRLSYDMCYLGVQNLNHMECFHHILSFSHKVDPRHRSDPAPTINKGNRGNDCVTNGRNLSPWMAAAWRSAPRQPESLTHLRARERNRYAVSPSQGARGLFAATAQLSLQLTHLPTRKTFTSVPRRETSPTDKMQDQEKPSGQQVSAQLTCYVPQDLGL